LAPNLTREEYGFLTKWREESRKKGLSCKHRRLAFFFNRQKLVKKKAEKGAAATISLKPFNKGKVNNKSGITPGDRFF